MEQIYYRELTLADMQPNLLKNFQRRQEVNLVWRNIGGKEQLVPEPFVDDWTPQDRIDKVEKRLKPCLREGGAVFGAFYQGEIAGFASVKRQLFGSRSQYADLLQLHVSNQWRRKGIGKKLFLQCAARAREWGAGKLYISAHSAQESQAFYRALGCVAAEEVNAAHVAEEPFDCQMEYTIK